MTLDALKAEVQASGYSWRKLELVLNLGNGYFSHLFAGRIDLKFRHIVAICEVLGLNTHDFFSRAYGVVPRPAEAIRLEDLRPLMHEVVDIILTERGYPRAVPQSLPQPLEPQPAPEEPGTAVPGDAVES